MGNLKSLGSLERFKKSKSWESLEKFNQKNNIDSSSKIKGVKGPQKKVVKKNIV